MAPQPPCDLRVETLVEPLGVATSLPRISWILRSDDRGDVQRAYQVLVSSERTLCENGIGDYWDTDRVESPRTYGIEYGGEALLSVKRFYWRVRWWNSRDEVSPWSEVAVFGTAFLNEKEWKPKWISLPAPREFKSRGNVLLGEFGGEYIQTYGIYLRKELALKGEVVSATAFVCGLGYYELRVNGRKAGDRVLDPAWTDYRKGALFATLDVTHLLAPRTAFGLLLGSGRHIRNYGYEQPQAACRIEIEYVNGDRDFVTTDETWKAGHGPLQENGLFHGERYDARLELKGWDAPGFDDAAWQSAVVLPGYPLASQMMPPIRVAETLKPRTRTEPEPGVYVFDFGQNFSGWVRLRTRGPRGTEIRLRHAELLDPAGCLNTKPNENADATDVFVLAGDGDEVYEPRFTYHGFRYVEVKGYPGEPPLDAVEGRFVHSDVERTGSFSSSDSLVNAVHRNVLWGQLSNLMSIPTDCPQRDERHGWLGDAHLSAEAAIFNFDMASFYIKFLEDIRLAQKEDGSLPDFVPAFVPRLYPADPAWASAYGILLWLLYWHYDDGRIVRRHYASFKSYVDFLIRNAPDGIVRNLGKYGDWCPPGGITPKKTPVELTATWFYCHDLRLLARFAQILGRHDEVNVYAKLADDVRDAFNAAFLEGDQYRAIRVSAIDTYPNQTSNLLPLALGLVPPDKKDAVLGRLLHAVVHLSDEHVDTGILGTRYLLDVLTDHGHADVAWRVATRTSYPGWGYMIAEGATTLWERWELLAGNAMNSHNHIMFGSIDAWFYRVVAGLTLLEPGWRKISVWPRLAAELASAEATVKTPRGEARVAWHREGEALGIDVRVPVGASAELKIPLLWEPGRIEESGRLLWENEAARETAPGVAFAGVEDRAAAFILESGAYAFTLRKTG